MKKEYALIIALFVGGFLYVNTLSKSQQPMAPSPSPVNNRSNCLADDCLLVDGLEYPVGTLPNDVKAALDQALDDEYKAFSTYQAIITKLGSTRPFSMIIGAEEQHIAQLKSIYTKYGEIPKANSYLGKITVPKTLADSCKAGVEAEIANASLYERELLPLVKNYPDISQVFTNLMQASALKHQPAFERCATR